MPSDLTVNNRPTDRLRARLLQFAFQSLYGPFAWAYDWVSRAFFMGQWRLWQRAAIPHLVGPDVLEVGMGTGDLQLDLHRAGFRSCGVDLSPQMLRRATLKARALGTSFNACRARAQALPFPDASFNSVVSTFPSEYIVDPATLSEIARVLRPGGRLVIVPGGWLERRGARGKALEGVARVVYGYRGEGRSADHARHVEDNPVLSRWVTTLNTRMGEAGFSLQARVATNWRGSCLIVIGGLRTED